MFTYRDFDGGTLGLAWTGDLKNAGGVCEKNGVSHTSILFSQTVFFQFCFPFNHNFTLSYLDK